MRWEGMRGARRAVIEIRERVMNRINVTDTFTISYRVLSCTN